MARGPDCSPAGHEPAEPGVSPLEGSTSLWPGRALHFLSNLFLKHTYTCKVAEGRDGHVQSLRQPGPQLPEAPLDQALAASHMLSDRRTQDSRAGMPSLAASSWHSLPVEDTEVVSAHGSEKRGRAPSLWPGPCLQVLMVYVSPSVPGREMPLFSLDRRQIMWG